MKCVYPARFYPEEDGGFSVIFQDFQGCVSQGDDLFEALTEAQDALKFWLETLEEEGKPLPKATALKEIKTEGSEFVTLIWVDTK